MPVALELLKIDHVVHVVCAAKVIAGGDGDRGRYARGGRMVPCGIMVMAGVNEAHGVSGKNGRRGGGVKRRWLLSCYDRHFNCRSRDLGSCCFAARSVVAVSG